jgi:hypothetical protein
VGATVRVRTFPWAVVTTALACLLLSGCSSGSPAKPAPSLAAAGHFVPTTIDQQVAAIAIRPADLATTQQRELIPGGAQVAGQVTMDNCGFDFTTEAFRVARREYVVSDEVTGQTEIGNEVVAYDTATHAAQALDQWYLAAEHCPTTAFRSSVAGVPPITATITSDRRNVADLPARPNVVTDELQTAADTGTMYGSARLQQHGRILDIMYVSSADPVTKVVDDQAVQLAQATGRRLLTVR